MKFASIFFGLITMFLTTVAQSATTLCLWFIFEEAEMPECLTK